ncbi:DUF3181 family protein [Anthocerotibacter panamensis]|uniref:DUF3181 family protein n=1 Tax=Anthocerotibacter panamensis TaxID=2857077 RepID=UPI001C407942|nr:DUF3181 family protein [Anthocerotibacter panamensis]
MNLRTRVETLAAALGQDVYLEIARWRLYLADAHLDVPLATQISLLMDDGLVSDAQIDAVLEHILVTLGDGNHQVPLAHFLPTNARRRLNQIVDEALVNHR